MSQVSMWSPWTSLSIESSVLQIFLASSFLFFILSSSFFYSLVYLFIFFVWVGIFLSYYGVEMFTGFFWVVELSVFFILLLFLFFLNYSGELSSQSVSYLPLLMALSASSIFFYDDYSVSVSLLNFGVYYSDFFESFSSSSMSDVHGLYLSYYVFNSFLLVLLGFFIFIVSVICVIILNASQSTYSEAVGEVLKSHNFFEGLLSFELLSSQNMSVQSLRLPLGSVFSRPPSGWSSKSQD